MPKIIWEKQTGPHQSGEWARVGKIIVGSAHYVTVSKGDPAKFGYNSLLPGIKRRDERFATLEEAKTRLENIILVWFKWVNEDDGNNGS